MSLSAIRPQERIRTLERMPAQKSFRRLFRITRFRSDPERDIHDEIAFYLEMRAREFMAEGLDPEQARQRALVVFGDLNSITATCRTILEPAVRLEKRRFFMNGLFSDIAFGLRNFRKNPVVALLAVLTLALGIGATSTILSLVNGILLQPLPYEDSGRIVMLWERLRNSPDAAVSWPNYLDWQERNTVFEETACYNTGHLILTGSGNPAELIAARITASTFALTGLEPVLGRVFIPEDDQIGAERVTILAWGLWHDRFGGDPGIVGRALTLGDETYTVIGIMGPDFIYPPHEDHIDLYVPIAHSAGDWYGERDSHPGIIALGRLRPGIDLEEARADLERIALELEQEYPDTNTGARINSEILQTRLRRNSTRPLMILTLAVSLLLLVACANVANILLVRATTRRQELAIRSTLGAGGGQLVRLVWPRVFCSGWQVEWSGSCWPAVPPAF